jgi:hypothetical protein
LFPRPREGHRRRFGEADKRRSLEEAAQPDASVSEVARRYGIDRRILCRWKQELSLYWDGTGFCLFIKRLEHGVFLWPPSIEPGETLSLTSAQLSLLIEGVDWRAPEQRWRPALAG